MVTSKINYNEVLHLLDMGQVKLVETAIGYGTIVGDFSYLTWKLEHIEVKLMAQYGELNRVKWGK